MVLKYGWSTLRYVRSQRPLLTMRNTSAKLLIHASTVAAITHFTNSHSSRQRLLILTAICMALFPYWRLWRPRRELKWLHTRPINPTLVDAAGSPRTIYLITLLTY